MLIVGLLLIVGYIFGKLTHMLKITSIIGYMIVGIIFGPYILGIFDPFNSEILHTVVDTSLAFVAFLIGASLTVDLARKLGWKIFLIIIGESFGAFIITAVGIYLLTKNPVLSLIFGSLAPASAPAGSVAVIHEYKANGILTNTILAVVGFDDGLAILIYVFTISIVRGFLGEMVSVWNTILIPIVKIFGAIVVGAIIGILLSYTIDKIHSRESLFLVSVSMILLSAGVCMILQLSLILSCMTLGFILVNLNPTSGRAVQDSIKDIMSPIYVVFFAIVGASLRFDLLIEMGLLGVVYILCRTAGLMGGATLTSHISNADPKVQKYLGFSILSQAGVAIGLASLISVDLGSLPTGAELGAIAVTIIAATSVVFEIIGPIGTRFALLKSGEAMNS